MAVQKNNNHLTGLDGLFINRIDRRRLRMANRDNLLGECTWRARAPPNGELRSHVGIYLMEMIAEKSGELKKFAVASDEIKLQ